MWAMEKNREIEEIKEKIIKEKTRKFNSFLLFLSDNSKLSKEIENKLYKVIIDKKFFYFKEYFPYEEPQIIIVKNKKVIDIIKGNFNQKLLKNKLKEYFDLKETGEKLVLEGLESEKLDIEKNIDREVEEKIREITKKLRFKRSFDVTMILRILLAVFIVILIIKLGIFIIKKFQEIYIRGQEAKFIYSLSKQVDDLLKKEEGSFISSKINVPGSREVCFTYSKETAQLFNKDYEFKDIYAFYKNNEIKAYSLHDQKNVFLIKTPEIYRAYLIRGLQSSIYEENPLCFRPGEIYYLVNYKNIIFITKNISKFNIN